MAIDKKSLLAVLFGMGLSLGVSANEYGQGGAQQSQPPQQQGGQAAANVDEASLNKFRNAYTKVTSIRESFAGKLENVENPQEAQELQQQAQEYMVSAVEESGLSVEEYNEISAAIHQYPELRQKALGDQ